MPLKLTLHITYNTLMEVQGLESGRVQIFELELAQQVPAITVETLRKHFEAEPVTDEVPLVLLVEKGRVVDHRSLLEVEFEYIENDSHPAWDAIPNLEKLDED